MCVCVGGGGGGGGGGKVGGRAPSLLRVLMYIHIHVCTFTSIAAFKLCC